MRVYLDVSCLNRPFDDQSQARVRAESEAVTQILEECELGDWQQVSSEMAKIEISAMPNVDRRARVRALLPDEDVLELSADIYARAKELETIGLKAADAVHVAAAETLEVDVFLSCDDRLCKLAKRRRAEIKVKVGNPL